MRRAEAAALCADAERSAMMAMRACRAILRRRRVMPRLML